MFKLMDKKIIAILRHFFFLHNWPYGANTNNSDFFVEVSQKLPKSLYKEHWKAYKSMYGNYSNTRMCPC